MSQDSTPDLGELVRSAFEHSSHRDVNALMSVYGPDSVFDTSPLGLGVYQGQAAIRGFFEDWVGTFEEFQIEPEEILDLGGGVTFAVALQSGRPVGGDRQVQWRYAAVSVWVGGVAARTTNYLDIDEARAAAERLAESRE
jgi:ketosteroid isomerase-like protein